MNKLQQTAKQILEVLGTFNLDMEAYTNGGNMPQNVCGTTFCLAGYLALLDEYPKIYRRDGYFDYTSYSENKIDALGDTVEWEFMFSEQWNNNVDLAKSRMEYVIEKGTIPPRSEWEHYGWAPLW